MTLYILTLLIATIANAAHRPAQSETAGFDAPLSADEQTHSKETNTCQSDSHSDSCDETILRDIDTHDPTAIRSYIKSTSAVGIKIKNSRSYPVHYFWVNTHYNPPQGQYNGVIPPHSVTATVSYLGHEFYVCTTSKSPQNESIFHLKVDGTQNLYVVPPDLTKQMEGYDQIYWENLQQEIEWSKQYEQRTGYPYLSYYDSTPGGRGSRPPPLLKFWSADFIGQKHRVVTNETYWHCLPDPSWPAEEANKKCRDKEGKGYIEIDMEVVSLYPPIFKIMGTTSSVESQYIIDFATPKLLRSRAGQHGGMVTDTRTSFNTWIGRHTHPIITTIYNRAADILGLERDDMRTKSEQLQVLHYDVGQEYSPHHDFGSSGSSKQRVMTILFYLNNQVDENAGGETYFPKAMGEGIKVHPGRGNSGLFYSILPDGNADDLSLHAALPVRKGEKWACNFWIWDPQFRG